MRIGNKWLSLLLAVGYSLTVSAAGLFHSHDLHEGDCCADHHGDGYRAAAGDECAVCQFLAQKPAPTAPPVPAALSTLLGSTIEPVLPAVSAEVFAAWQSRAPPIG
jgi:hypothetical protein